jgi:uncharacterized protein (DUF952 family)
MSVIYHVTTLESWQQAQEDGYYEAHSLSTEGFIHCSKAEQVAGVLQRYFAGQKNLVKLVIETSKLTAPLQYDLSPSLNETFPHVYGRINLAAVVDTEMMTNSI